MRQVEYFRPKPQILAYVYFPCYNNCKLNSQALRALFSQVEDTAVRVCGATCMPAFCKGVAVQFLLQLSNLIGVRFANHLQKEEYYATLSAPYSCFESFIRRNPFKNSAYARMEEHVCKSAFGVL